MAITLNLPKELEEKLLDEVARKGRTVEQYLMENTCLTGEVCVRRTPPFDVSLERLTVEQPANAPASQ